MSIFDFSDYKDFVRLLVRTMQNKGRGQFKKMAEYLGVNSVVISQIFKSDKNLTPEQAVELADFFGMTKPESEYFILLVQKERAGTARLKKILQEQIKTHQARGRELQNRLPKDLELTDQAKAIFYSSWFYSGIRLLSSIDQFQSVDAMSEHFGLERATIQKAVNFLVEQGLCLRDGGRVLMGPQRTHLGSDSPLIARHHANWRVRGFSRMDQPASQELFFTGPMALSLEAAVQVRQELLNVIKKISDIAVESKSETTLCLNLDYFSF